MKNSNTKRYLVTYTEGSTDISKASKMLGIAKDKCVEGVSFLATDAVPSSKDILHFENLGITSLELTTEDADRFSATDGILSVEEDTEMYALGYTSEENIDNAFDNSFEMSEFNNNEEDDNYLEGYNDALIDMFASMLKLNKNNNSQYSENQFSPMGPGSGIIPRPIPKPFPIPFPPIRPFQPVPWNINLVKAPQAWARGIRGNGVKVAVLDTGIAAHPDLVISGGVSFIPGVVSYNDGHGHGTHCAGVIGARNNWIGVVGVAPLCNLYAVKVLADSGSGSSSGIIAGMEWCINNGIKVISMSLGSNSAPSVAYANAIKRCQDNGITVVCASGNSFGSAFPWVGAPANSIISGVPNASPIAVGAVNSACVIAPFSSRGGNAPLWNQVTVVAPGVNVYSTYKGGGYTTMSGTSMATPHVAGLAALVYQRYPGITPPFLKSRIASTATNLGPAGYDQTYGYGLVNCLLATW
jgi:subtilisin